MKLLKQTLAAAVITATAISAQAQTMTIEGGGASSTTGLVPQGFAPHASKAGYDLQVVLGQTLTKSITKVAAGKLDMAVAPPAAYRAMTKGVGPYAKLGDKAVALSKNVRALFAFQGSTMHPLVWADSDIKSWDDIKGKRVFVGPPAGAAASMSAGYIEIASGLKMGDDYEPVKVPWNQAAQGFQDGQYDVYMAYYPVGSQVLTELSLQRETRLLSQTVETLSSDKFKAYELNSGISGVVIPANTYGNMQGIGTDVGTGATMMMIIANKEMSDEDAYNITKTYWDALPSMKDANALLRSQDASKPLFGLSAKLHSGAIRYYEEQGVEIPAKLR